MPDLPERLVTIKDPLGLFSDLILVIAWLFLTVTSIFLPPLNTSFLRVVFALPSILFIPGYVLIAALFPKKQDLDVIERIALSFGLSIAIVPLVGLALNYTPWGIRLEPVVTSLVVLTVFLSLAGAIRRVGISAEEQFRVPFRPLVQEARTALTPTGGSRLDRALNVLLLASILIAVGATVFVITVPKEGEKFTEFYILGEAGKAAGYPRDLVTGETYRLIIGVGNHEYRNVSYSVECLLVNMTFDPDTNESTLETMELLDRFPLTVAHNSTTEIPWNFSVREEGFNRVEFLLYNESVPDDAVWGLDRINASYRDLHLWVEVRTSRSGAASIPPATPSPG